MKSYISFQKPFLLWTGLLVLFGAGVVLKAAYVTDGARVRYDEIIASQPRKARKNKLKQKQELTKQTRWDVHKTIWLGEGPLRRTVELEAKRSEMAMFATRHSMHFVETFYTVSGFVQQELYYKDRAGNEYVYNIEGMLQHRDKNESLATPIDITSLTPMQCFRYFEAEKAICDFDTESLVAMNIKFWTYVTTGHEPPRDRRALSPVAIGRARSMTLPKKNNEREFYAEELKLKIMNERGVW